VAVLDTQGLLETFVACALRTSEEGYESIDQLTRLGVHHIKCIVEALRTKTSKEMDELLCCTCSHIKGSRNHVTVL
jgi:hypothetical protein